MKPSRRRFVIGSTGAGAALLAGCVGALAGEGDDEDNGNNPDNGDGDDDNGDNGNGDPCEPLAFPFVDEPPHEPDRPATPIDDEDDWDDHYLGDGMDEEGDLDFTPFHVQFRESVAEPPEYSGESVFYTALYETKEEFDEAVEPVGKESEEVVDEINFDEQVVVAVLSGFGSSSVRHEWVRGEENCDELHVHGYYVKPYIQTEDYTTRISAVAIDRPESGDVDRAWVSLTADTDTRVNISSDNGLQKMSDEDEGGAELPGPIENVGVLPVKRESPGGWWSEESEKTGVVVELSDTDEVRGLLPETTELDEFIADTDFSEEYVYYVESVGPTACYRGIEVGSANVIANGEGYFLQANARVVDESDDDTMCAEVITFPGLLVRVTADVELRTAEVRLSDGWGNQKTAEAQSLGEFAQE